MIPCNFFYPTPCNILWFKMHIMRRTRISLNYSFRTVLPKRIHRCHSSPLHYKQVHRVKD
jgi:hypothetical protein